MTRLLSCSLAALAALAAPAGATEWALDPAHSEIGFDVRHMMVSDVHGAFDKYVATIVVDDQDPTKTQIDVQIDAGSINTRLAKRDTHLTGAEFFDAKSHPKLTFKSTKVEKAAKASTYKVTGDLTIRGTSKPVVLDLEVTDEWADPKEWGGQIHRGAKATTKINRQDFGLKWQMKLDKGGIVLGDEVNIVINAELIKQQPKVK